MLCCPARSPRRASSWFPGGTFKLSSPTAAFKMASFLNALRCRSTGRRRLLPECHSLSVSLSPKLTIIRLILTRRGTTVKRYYGDGSTLPKAKGTAEAAPVGNLLIASCCLYVPSLHPARYSSCSGVKRSIFIPMDSSFSLATRLSSSSGTRYTVFSSVL